jgi:AIPR protein
MTLSVQILDQRIRHAEDVMRSRLVGLLGRKAGGDEHRRLSAAFTVMVLKTALGLDDADAIDALVDGGDDFGVDAIHWAAPRGGLFRVTLVQTKLRKRLDGESNFDEGGVRGMIDAIRTLLDMKAEFTGNPRLRTKVDRIRVLVGQGHIPQVTAVLANNGKPWTQAAQQRIDNAGFGDQVEWTHVGPDRILALLRPQMSIDANLRLTGKYLVEEFDFRRALVGRISVGELARLFTQHGDRLLERNVRRFLGLGDSRINQGMAATLQDPAEHGNFYFYNNGLTVVCRKFRHHGLQSQDTSVQVEGMQIVNGGQTSQVIARVLADMAETPNASVLLRIHELEDDAEQVVNNITYATNSQNPVVLSDLKANDPVQIRLEQSIEALGYRYRRKRSDAPLAENEITSTELARAVLTVWRGHNASKVDDAELFSTYYDLAFRELNGAQAVIAVEIMRNLRTNDDAITLPLDAIDPSIGTGAMIHQVWRTLVGPAYNALGPEIAATIVMRAVGAKSASDINHNHISSLLTIARSPETYTNVIRTILGAHQGRKKTGLFDFFVPSPERIRPELEKMLAVSMPASNAPQKEQ